MADRYWVGGTGPWDAATTTHWSATSGGASGASAPTSADNVIFDALSGFAASGSVQCAGAVACLSFTYTPNIALGFIAITIDTSLTINGTLSTSGTAGNNRLFFRALTTGIATNLVVTTLGSISDIDFRDIYVTGTAAPLTGTRLGNVANGRGVTFSAPKTVYWNLAGAQNWTANGWAATSGGTPSTNNFPLVQDTAVFDNTGSVTGTITMGTQYPYYGNIDMSARTTAMTIATGSGNQIYGDWKNGSGTTFSGTTLVTFQSRTTQTITSAGKTWLAPIIVNTFGGTVQLGDALNIGTNILTLTSGNFVTNGYAVTADSISSSTAGPRSISLGASSVTLSSITPLAFTAGDGLTFNAGTSTITVLSTITSFSGLGFTYYDFSIPSGTSTVAITGANTFHNLTIVGIRTVTVAAAQTFTGSLVYVGAPTTRLTFASDAAGIPRTLVANGAFSSTNIDFRDVAVTGTSAPISGSTLGNLGGNSGITFTNKTVYWNLAGAQNWTATGWALTSGGTPAAANFPLAQDIAVFDNTGSVTGTITFVTGYAYPTVDMSARTAAMTLATVAASIYGDWKNGSGTTLSGTGILSFVNRSVTQTITSAGRTFTQSITIDSITGTTQLADALVNTASAGITFTSGTFIAGANNITSPAFQAPATVTSAVNMGSGTWTATSSGTAWNFNSGAPLTLNSGTSNIVLSNSTTTARTFAGGTRAYYKLTLGGTAITSTTISGGNTFAEIASTKTTAHTLALGTTGQAIGKWSVTGTVGNVVTVTGAGSHAIAGARVTGVDYLAMGTTSFSATSPGEFYAGVNSTGTGVGVILTAAPAAVTRYWVGGTGTWDATTTTHWSATSGGTGGASVPTSADAVIFDTLSNATAYTVTCTSGTALRCAGILMGAPLTGAVTWAGTAPLVLQGNTSLTGGASITRTYTGALTLSGSTTGYTVNTNGVTLASTVSVDGVGCGWALASALNIGASALSVTRGDLDTAGYSLVTASITSSGNTYRSLSLGASSITLSAATPVTIAGTKFTLNAGTSTITVTAASPFFNGAGLAYNDVVITGASNTTVATVTGANTFNNLSITAANNTAYPVIFNADQIFTGTLVATNSSAINRIFIQTDTSGTQRIFSIGTALASTDFDFQNIAVTGAAAPISGTRIGDCGGNSGITFSTPKTVYWNLTAAQNWFATGWASTSGGTPAVANFPLAQDTAVFDEAGAATSVVLTARYAYPNIDMSARTSALSITPGSGTSHYGDWKNGSGTTIAAGTSPYLYLRKRGTQTITSAGKTFTNGFIVDSISGIVQLADALVTSSSTFGITFTSGTFDAVSYNVTSPLITNSGTASNTVSIGSGTWTVNTSGTGWNFATTTNLAFNKGTGNILLSDTTTTARTFAGGGLSYPKLTIGGATGTSTTTITGNNSFAEIASIKTVASTLALTTTIQTVGIWTASGTAGALLSVTGTSVTTPAYLVLTGAGPVNVDYLNISNVRATPLTTTWYAGTYSTNGGSLGWYFVAGGTIIPSGTGNFFMFF